MAKKEGVEEDVQEDDFFDEDVLKEVTDVDDGEYEEDSDSGSDFVEEEAAWDDEF